MIRRAPTKKHRREIEPVVAAERRIHADITLNDQRYVIGTELPGQAFSRCLGMSGCLVETHLVYAATGGIGEIRIEVHVAASEPNRILADEPLKPGVIEARPIVVESGAIILSPRIAILIH